MIAGVNGFIGQVRDNNYNLVGPLFKGDYGNATGQFSKMANLWNTYRVLSVHARFIPSSTFVSASVSPVISIVDVVGGNNVTDFA